MKKIFGKLWSRFLAIFGDIKLFKWPMFFIYDPDIYGISGGDMRRILSVVRPGDIVARAYRHYLDGMFIPGKYTHTGIYIGNGNVIHAVAEGVCKTDILDFIQADRCAVLRPVDAIGNHDVMHALFAVNTAVSMIGKKYDYFFTEGDDAFYCHELTAACYKELGVEKLKATAMWGLIRKKDPVYLYQSFADNPNFKLILEV